MTTVEVTRLIILSLFGSGTNKFMHSEGSDELAHMRSLTRTFTARLQTEDTYMNTLKTHKCRCLPKSRQIADY